MQMTSIVWIVSFVGFWVVITALIAIAGGWHLLASMFPAPSGFAPDREHTSWFLRSLRLRRGNWLPSYYGGGFTVGTSAAGLYLAAPTPFRLFHAPILIPWRSIERCRRGSFLRSWVECELPGPNVTIRVYGRFGGAVEFEWRQHSVGGPAA